MRVLIADDEPPLLRRLSQILTELGCTIVSQHMNGAKAIEWMRANPGAVDAMFLDVQMPGATGLEVANTFSSIPTIIVSSVDLSIEAWEIPVTGYILKPLKAAAAANALTRLHKEVALASLRPGLIATPWSKPECFH